MRVRLAPILAPIQLFSRTLTAFENIITITNSFYPPSLPIQLASDRRSGLAHVVELPTRAGPSPSQTNNIFILHTL
ncbi:hypothetical protein F5050DRAFT_1778000, partial [Lentinula boryana]